jgi:hypothetical protein
MFGPQWNGILFADAEGMSPPAAVSSDSVNSRTPATQAPISARLATALSITQQPSRTPELFSAQTILERPHLTLENEGLETNAIFGATAGRTWSSSAFASAGQIYQGPPIRYPRERNRAALTAIAIGAVASITGTALLVYANRPECNMNQTASGCYGTKVVGGAVLSGGLVSLMVGALMWR